MDARKHVNTIGVIYIVFGCLYALGGILFIAGMNSLGDFTGDEVAEGVLNVSGVTVGVILFILAALQIAAGVGLKKYENWARILTIIVSFLILFSFPFGTILGVYALWVLFRKDAQMLFHGNSASRY